MKKKVIGLLFGALMMTAASGLMQLWGMEEELLFNRGLLSLGVLAFGYVCAGWFLDNRREDRRIWAISYLMGAALAFTEVLGTALWCQENAGGFSLNGAGFVFLLCSGLIFGVPLEVLFYRICHLQTAPLPSAYGTWSLTRWFFLFWIILFGGYLPCLLAFYPGLYCYDMVWQWQQFAEGVYSTHHPLLHTWLSSWLIETGNGLFGSYQKGLLFHSLFQLVVMSGCLSFALCFLVKRKVRPFILLGVGAFFLLFPFFPVMGISTTKDTIFGSLFLVVFVCICDMAAEKRIYRGIRLAAFLAAAVLMCLFRNNALYGLIVFAGLLLLAAFWQRLHGRTMPMAAEMIGLAVLVILASKGSLVLLEKGFQAEKGSSAEMLSVPMQQMARSYVFHTEEFTEEEKEQLFSFFEKQNIESYQYWLSDPVKSGMKMEYFYEHKEEFLRLWMHLGKKFPKEYLEAPLLNTFGLWYLGGDSSCFVEYKMLEPFDEARRVITESRLPWLKDLYGWFTDQNLQKNLPGISILFYTSFYSWCVACSAGILWARRRYGYLILPLFAACYNFSLLFGPCMTIRYMLGSMFCVPVLFVMTFLSGPEAPDSAGLSESA